MRTKEEILNEMTYHNQKAVEVRELWKKEFHHKEYHKLSKELQEMGFKRTTRGWI